MSRRLRFPLCLIVAAIPFSGCRDNAEAPLSKAPQPIAASLNAPNDAPDTASSQTPSTCSLPPSFDRYNEAMKAWKSGPHPASMAELWRLADSASDSLMNRLDCLTESDYERAQTTFVGHVVSRDDQYLSDPWYEFFQIQADSFGTASDRAFFAFAKEYMYRKRAWVWEEQSSDVDWCTRIGSPSIVDGYFKAESLSVNDAPEYRWWLESRLAEVDSFRLQPSCVCETRKGAQKGLKRSIERVPDEHPLRKALETSLAAIDRNDPSAHFSCHIE